MSLEKFCTCDYYDCIHHPNKNNNECNACIKKNLQNLEIPACFFNKIGSGEGVDSDYTFYKFAEKVMSSK